MCNKQEEGSPEGTSCGLVGVCRELVGPHRFSEWEEPMWRSEIPWCAQCSRGGFSQETCELNAAGGQGYQT